MLETTCSLEYKIFSINDVSLPMLAYLQIICRVNKCEYGTS